MLMCFTSMYRKIDYNMSGIRRLNCFLELETFKCTFCIVRRNDQVSITMDFWLNSETD